MIHFEIKKDADAVELKLKIKSNKSVSDKKLDKNSEKEIITMKEKQCKFITINEDADVIDKISETAQAILDRDNNIQISNPAAIPTIVYQFLKCTIDELNRRKKPGEDVEINLMHLLDLGITCRESDEEEKDANFTPYCTPGQEFKLAIKDDGITEE
jgi:hypothetical protein